MRFRYYACSFFWFYCSLIFEICIIRPVWLLRGQEDFITYPSATPNQRHQAPPLFAANVDDSVLSTDDNHSRNVVNININQRQDKPLPLELLNVLEKQFLYKMGLKTRPRPKRKVVVPDKLRELYDQMMSEHTYDDTTSDDGSDLDSLRPVWDSARSFFPEPDDDDANVPINVLTFNLTSLPTRERVEGADLALLLDDSTNTNVDDAHSSEEQEQQQTVVLRFSISDTIRNHTVLMDTVQVKCGSSASSAAGDGGRWLTFDVGGAVRRWLYSTTKTGRLQIDVHSRNGAERFCGVHLHRTASTSSSKLGGLSRAPVLIVYTSDVGWNDDERTERTKRSAPDATGRFVRTTSAASTKQVKKHRKGRQKTHRRPELCRRRELHIDFESVGWNDWIVAPTGYDAFYCSGECVYPLSDALNATNHAIVQTLVHSVNPGAAPKSCCVPTELGPISMLYLDEFDKVVLKTYQDMVVIGCGCR